MAYAFRLAGKEQDKVCLCLYTIMHNSGDVSVHFCWNKTLIFCISPDYDPVPVDLLFYCTTPSTLCGRVSCCLEFGHVMPLWQSDMLPFREMLLVVAKWHQHLASHRAGKTDSAAD